MQAQTGKRLASINPSYIYIAIPYIHILHTLTPPTATLLLPTNRID